MRLALAQINPIVGDLDGNRALILERIEDAKCANADLVVFPELAVTGYPPEDLLLRPGFLRDREREEMFRTRARDNIAYVAFCNTVGGQDELIFDGHSLVIDDEGTALARAPGFEEAMVVVDVDPSAVRARRLTDARRRALAQDRGDLGTVPTIHIGAPHAQSDHVEAGVTPVFDELRQKGNAAQLGPPPHRRKNGV